MDIIKWIFSQNLLDFHSLFVYRGKIMQKIRWSDVAKELEKNSKSNSYKTPKLCRERWNNYLNPELKKLIFKGKTPYFI